MKLRDYRAVLESMGFTVRRQGVWVWGAEHNGEWWHFRLPEDAQGDPEDVEVIEVDYAGRPRY